MKLSNKAPNWDWEEQKRLEETKCGRCGLPCDEEDKRFCEAFNFDGGTGH